MGFKAKAVSAVSVEELQRTESAINGYLRDPNTWTVFTDGSALRNPGPGGAAAVLVLTPSRGKEKKERGVNEEKGTKGEEKGEKGEEKGEKGERDYLMGMLGFSHAELKTASKTYVAPKVVTNNQMELKGVELALDLLEEHHKGNPRSKWIILTDSEYVHGLLEKGNTAHKNAEIVASLRERIAKLRSEQKVEITINWVRSHCGVFFNEKADTLSREAAQQSKKSIAPNGAATGTGTGCISKTATKAGSQVLNRVQRIQAPGKRKAPDAGFKSAPPPNKRPTLLPKQ